MPEVSFEHIVSAFGSVTVLEAQLPELKAIGCDTIEPWLPAYEADPAGSRAAAQTPPPNCSATPTVSR